tara:strand:- start:1112 stop:2629 length:1518 start_codon:yes stop_codon:yes gene_type:complete
MAMIKNRDTLMLRYPKLRIYAVLTQKSVLSTLCLLSLLLFDIVDMFLILPLGRDAFIATMGYAHLILFFMLSAAVGLALCASLVWQKQLSDDPTKNGTLLCSISLIVCILSMCLALILFFITPWLLELVHVSDVIKEYISNYLTPLLLGLPCMSLAMAWAVTLCYFDKFRYAAQTMVAGGLSHLVFASILMYQFDLGVQGLAFALLAGWLMTLLITGYALFQSTHLSMSWQASQWLRGIKSMLVDFIATMSLNFFIPLGQGFMFFALVNLYEEKLLEWVIMSKLTPLFLVFMLSVSHTAGKWIQQALSHGHYQEMRTVFTSSIKYLSITACLSGIVLLLLLDVFFVMFESSDVSLSLLYQMGGYILFSYLFLGLMALANTLFENIGKANLALIFNLASSVLVAIPLISLATLLGELNYIYMAQLFYSALCGMSAIAVAYYVCTVLEKNRIRDLYHLKDEKSTLTIMHFHAFSAGYALVAQTLIEESTRLDNQASLEAISLDRAPA